MTTPVNEPVIRRKFVLTDLDGNSNKEWMVEYWPSGDMTTTWGRVGHTPQSKTKHVSGEWAVNDLIREKEDKGYREIKLLIPQNIVTPTSAPAYTDQRVQMFVDLVFKEAGERISTYLAVGINSLSQQQITEGRKLLDKIGKETSRAAIEQLAQQYFTTIPTQLPSRIDRTEVVNSLIRDLAEQEDRLNQLEAGIAVYAQQQTGQNSQVTQLGVDLATMDKNSKSYTQIADYVLRTYGGRLTIHDMFKVVIPGERQAWESETTGKHAVTSLFHGTRSANVRHILRTGLIIPHHAANGSRFGRGIYFADKSKRSYNYCGGNSRFKIMFIADVALGTPKKLTGDDGRLTQAPAGYDSVWGVQSYSGMDEFIIYKPSQQTIRAVVVLE